MKEQILLDLVKDAIQAEFEHKEIDREKYSEIKELNEDGATFVTINLNGHLRGCIGSLSAYRSLGDDIISNAKAAAFEDPRFYQLTPEEFAKAEF